MKGHSSTLVLVHKDIIPDLPSAHALTVVDTVAQCFMIGKATALKTLQAGIPLLSLDNIDSHIDDVKESTTLKARCYGLIGQTACPM